MRWKPHLRHYLQVLTCVRQYGFCNYSTLCQGILTDINGTGCSKFFFDSGSDSGNLAQRWSIIKHTPRKKALQIYNLPWNLSVITNLSFFLSPTSICLTTAGVQSYCCMRAHARTQGMTPLDEWPARRRGLYTQPQNCHKTNTHVPGEIRTRNPCKREVIGLRLWFTSNRQTDRKAHNYNFITRIRDQLHNQYEAANEVVRILAAAIRMTPRRTTWLHTKQLHQYRQCVLITQSRLANEMDLNLNKVNHGESFKFNKWNGVRSPVGITTRHTSTKTDSCS